jgi:ligand-binding sensor domain-containing protein
MNKTLILILIFLSGWIVAQNKADQEKIDLEFFLSGSQVTGITSDGINIWFATNGNGVFKYTPANQQWVQYSTSKGNLTLDFFYCIAADKDYVWAGSTDGLFILDKKRDSWTKRKFALGGQLANWIRVLTYDKYAKAVWIGRFKYLTKYDIKRNRYTDYDLTDGKNEKSNNFKAIAVEGDSLVWFGTEGGLHKYDKSKDLRDNDNEMFYDNRYNYFQGEGEQISVSSILLERNYIWLGLDEFVTPERPEFNVGGIFRFNKKNEWIKIDDSKGLPGNGVYDLERTGNYIWVSLYQFGKTTKETYGRGLALIDRSTNKVTPIRDERIPRTVYSIYFDGVNLWLGTESGLIKVDFFNKLAQWKSGAKK